MSARARDIVTAIMMILPFAVVLGTFTIYPIFQSLRLSFMDFSYLQPEAAEWVGLDQFAELADQSDFRTAVRNTILLTVIVVPVQSAIALLLANGLNQRIRAQGFFRTVYFLPYVTPPVAVGAVMIFLFNRDGIMTRLASLFGASEVSWYANTPYAFWLVIFVMIWTQVGFFTVIYLAGLQSIDLEVFEAAAVDGAKPSQTMWHVTIPQLKPTTFFVLATGTIITLQIFEQPWVISTFGGAEPGSPANSTLTMVMYLYTQAFRYFEMGRASAAAVVIFLIVGGFTIVQAALQRRTG